MKLEIAGAEASQLAARFGTPVYVYDQNRLEERMRQFRQVFSSRSLTVTWPMPPKPSAVWP